MGLANFNVTNSSGTAVRQQCLPCDNGMLQPHPGQLRCLICPATGVNCIDKAIEQKLEIVKNQAILNYEI